MSGANESNAVHPAGEPEREPLAYPVVHRAKTLGGPMHLHWEAFIEQRRLRCTSPNGPTEAEILGAILCGVLGGHRRYAYITAMRGDSVLPTFLRDDIAHGDENMMQGAKQRGVPYFFKLRQTKGLAQLK